MKSKIPNSIFQFTWHFIRPYQWSCLGILLAMVYASLSVSLEPYALKEVIDAVIQDSDTPQALFTQVTPKVVFFLSVGFFLVIAWRIRDYLTLRMEPAIHAAVVEELFDYIADHSYRFFQENFGGNVAIKIRDLATSVENLIEGYREFFRHTTTILIASLMLGTVKWYLGIILFFWAFSFAAIVFFLARWISGYSSRLADTRNSSFGRIVDIVTNISNVRFFSHKKFELVMLRKTMAHVACEDRKLRWAFFKLWTIQGALSFSMMAVMISSLIGLRVSNRCQFTR